MISYVIAAIAFVLVMTLGVPLMERLVRRIWPLTPKQEESEHFLHQARRSIDKYRRY